MLTVPWDLRKPKCRLHQRMLNHGARFTYDPEVNTYTCPQAKNLTTSGTVANAGTTHLYRGSTFDCGPCHLKEKCCPKRTIALCSTGAEEAKSLRSARVAGSRYDEGP